MEIFKKKGKHSKSYRKSFQKVKKDSKKKKNIKISYNF